VDALTPPEWTAIPLVNSGTAGTPPPRYRVHGGYCYLEGNIEHSSGSFPANNQYHVATLPLEARPIGTFRSPVVGGTASAWGRLDCSPATGAVSVAAISGTVTYLSLTGVFWPVA